MEVQANIVRDYELLLKAGDCIFSRLTDDEKPSGLYYICPCGCDKVGYLPFKDGPNSTGLGPQWEFNGNEESPTLTPSILDRRCHYHGFLTNGVFKSC